MAISFWELVLELGLSLQPFHEPFPCYKDWVTWGWMTSLWEKCTLYNVRIDILDTDLLFPRERDCWLMQRFVGLGFSVAQLVILNRVVFLMLMAAIWMQNICTSGLRAINGLNLNFQTRGRRYRISSSGERCCGNSFQPEACLYAKAGVFTKGTRCGIGEYAQRRAICFITRVIQWMCNNWLHILAGAGS